MLAADVSAIDSCREILRLIVAFEPEGSEDSNAHDHQTCYQPMTFQQVHDILTLRIRSALLVSCIAGPSDINPERRPGLRIESLASVVDRKPHHDGWDIGQGRCIGWGRILQEFTKMKAA